MLETPREIAELALLQASGRYERVLLPVLEKEIAAYVREVLEEVARRVGLLEAVCADRLRQDVADLLRNFVINNEPARRPRGRPRKHQPPEATT